MNYSNHRRSSDSSSKPIQDDSRSIRRASATTTSDSQQSTMAYYNTHMQENMIRANINAPLYTSYNMASPTVRQSQASPYVTTSPVPDMAFQNYGTLDRNLYMGWNQGTPQLSNTLASNDARWVLQSNVQYGDDLSGSLAMTGSDYYTDLNADNSEPENTGTNNQSPQDQGDSSGQFRCWDHGCEGRSFSSASNFRRHQQEQAGRRRRYNCPRCGRSFTRSTARNVHVRTALCQPTQ